MAAGFSRRLGTWDWRPGLVDAHPRAEADELHQRLLAACVDVHFKGPWLALLTRARTVTVLTGGPEANVTPSGFEGPTTPSRTSSTCAGCRKRHWATPSMPRATRTRPSGPKPPARRHLRHEPDEDGRVWCSASSAAVFWQGTSASGLAGYSASGPGMPGGSPPP